MVPTHLLPAQSNPWGRKSLLRGAGEHEAMDFDKNDAAGEINRKLGGHWLTFQIVLTISSSLFGWSCQCN